MTQTFKFSVWDGYSNNVFYRQYPSYDVASNIISNYPPGYIASVEPVLFVLDSKDKCIQWVDEYIKDLLI